MEIIHRTRKHELKGFGSSLFLLENKKGGYALLGHPSCTHHGGIFFFLPDEWTLFKTIEDIKLDVRPRALRNKFYSIERRSADVSENFFFFGKTFYYDVKNYSGGVTIDLDMRRVYDSPGIGRSYKIYSEQGAVVVEYSFSGESFFLVIRGASKYSILNEWFPRSYEYDAARGGLSERWVYRGLRFDCVDNLRLSFTFGSNKEQVLLDASTGWNERDSIRSRVQQFTHSVKTNDSVPFSSAVFALESLVMSLNGSINRTGVFAGLPWFFQFWSRDELISLQGLVLAEKYSLVKDILLRYVANVGIDGRLSNRVPSANLGCADGIGWLWKRLGDFISYLDKNNLLWEYFSVAELEDLTNKLEGSLRLVKKNYLCDGLIINASKETWMDTHGDTGDDRAGARVEIQALTLASVNTLLLLYKLTKKTNGKEFKVFQKSLVAAVRKVLVVDGVLGDGFFDGVDSTIRPNVFLAYYVFPDLLTKKQWLKTFDVALGNLWLDWGGLATISKDHPLFCSDYSGQDNKSYHRGDSWFWVNNFAALAMHGLDAEKYKFHVNKIKDASVRDLLWMGVVGQCSEISSASKQTASGCFAQAWSAASLVELLNVLKE